MAATDANSGMWTLLDTVDHTKLTWAVKVRVIRAYEVPAHAKGGDTLELVLHDAVGTRIHAIIKRPQMGLFKSKIQENGVYGIRKFLVVDNYQTFKTTNHPYMIQFISKTQVKAETIDFPSYVFDFQSFEALQAQRIINDKLLIDVIGKFLCKGPAQTHIVHGRTERVMELTLGDPEGNRMTCVLWNKYIDQFMDYVNQHGQENLFIIFQLCRPRRFQGALSVSSSYDVSKLILNGNTTEMVEFRNQFPPDNEDTTIVTHCTQNSLGESSRDAALNGRVKLTTMLDLLSETEEGFYWLLGEIVSIENYTEWCYMSCNACKRKLKKEEDKFICATCKVAVSDGVYRYRVSVEIMDDTSHGTFVLWDRECTDILGKTSATLRSEMEKKTGDPNSFPEDIESLVDQRGLFKIHLKKKTEESSYKGTNSLGLVCMIRDPSILAIYADKEKEVLRNDAQDKEERSGSSGAECEKSTARKGKGKADQDRGKGLADQDKDAETIEVLDSPLPSTQREIAVEVNDQIKRNLNDEFSASGAAKRLKIKIKEEPL